MAKYQLCPPPFPFVEKECRQNCGCYIDPVQTLVTGYQALLSAKWDACLRAKWSIGDCVSGCHNPKYSVIDPVHRNSHQKRLTRKSIAKLISELETQDLPKKALRNFETIYGWVSDTVKPIISKYKSEQVRVDIGPLLKYDVALRMAYNITGPDGQCYAPADNHLLPKKMVYLQCGALKGARALLKISQLSREEHSLNRRCRIKNYLTNVTIDELKGAAVIPYACFDAILRELNAYHLENFLCIYHQLLEDWADGMEARIAKLKEKQTKKKTKQNN